MIKPNTAQPRTAAIDGMAMACRQLALWVLAAVICLIALPGYAEQVPIYDAPYEVIEGDPSCNGPDQRLVRIKFRVPDFFQHVQEGTPECYVLHRRGVERVRMEIPCSGGQNPLTANHNMPTDATFSMNAVFEICQSPWEYEFKLKSGAVSVTRSDKEPVIFPLKRPIFDGGRIRPIAEGKDQETIALLEIGCEALSYPSYGFGNIGGSMHAYFNPRLASIDECADGACLSPIYYEEQDIGFSQLTRLYLTCGEPEQGTSE